MPDPEKEKSEEFTTYYCPNCQEPLAFGTLYHLKVICPNCKNLFVMVGLDQDDHDK